VRQREDERCETRDKRNRRCRKWNRTSGSLLKVTERFFIRSSEICTLENCEGKSDENRTKCRGKGTRFGWKCGGNGLFLNLLSHDFA
jgi:hypothetical protein